MQSRRMRREVIYNKLSLFIFNERNFIYSAAFEVFFLINVDYISLFDTINRFNRYDFKVQEENVSISLIERLDV